MARTLERFFRATNFYEVVCYLGLALRDYHAWSSFCSPCSIDSRVHTMERVRYPSVLRPTSPFLPR